METAQRRIRRLPAASTPSWQRRGSSSAALPCPGCRSGGFAAADRTRIYICARSRLSSRSNISTVAQVVVVLSGSMEPGFYRGDILFLYMGRRQLQAGEVRVCSLLKNLVSRGCCPV